MKKKNNTKEKPVAKRKNVIDSIMRKKIKGNGHK